MNRGIVSLFVPFVLYMVLYFKEWCELRTKSSKYCSVSSNPISLSHFLATIICLLSPLHEWIGEIVADINKSHTEPHWNSGYEKEIPSKVNRKVSGWILLARVLVLPLLHILYIFRLRDKIFNRTFVWR